MSLPRSSRSTSRKPLPRAHSRSRSVIFLPGGAESLLVPGGSVGSPAADSLSLVHESVSSMVIGNTSEETAQKVVTDNDDLYVEDEINEFEQTEEEIQEREEMMKRPFYRRPSPWWILGMALLSATATSTTLAPRVELYTALACEAIKPEYTESYAKNQHWGAEGKVPPPSKLCGSDPDVQAAVARLITVILVASGVLSCLTTGWWGQLSDRYGRIRILSIATVGLLATDLNYILVCRAADRLPGGYRFLLVGHAFDGLLGGMSTLMAGLHAYVSDCTPSDERARIFSLNSGLFFCGMALGPSLGGLLIEATNDLLSVFYLATGAHLIYGIFIWFIIPESLPESSMRNAKKRREAQRSKNIAARLVTIEQNGFSLGARIMSSVKVLFVFLAPLNIFIPTKRPDGRGRDWNLLLVVFSYVFHMLQMGSYQFKMQYVQRTFGWSAEALGYWLSAVGVTRALHLIFILPLFIRYIKPKRTPIQLPISPEEPLHPAGPSTEYDRAPSRPTPRTSYRSPALFELLLARVSLVLEVACYTGMTLATSPAAFVVAAILDSFGAGFSPAMQSVGLALYEQGPYRGMETGRLFGGLSVAASLGSQIIGPFVYGFTYVSTVNSFPKGVFVLSAGVEACALFFMLLVHLSRDPPPREHEETATHEAE